eukprot:CAMPEP_0170526298 /NCGR_PEP_ID=MMETSP0209-20121228/11749_1 /TAXON_ID=665100 ORGANISM="Litonotus pictus, Strain P1" /NCGR_SAMPLE_ID=MMETSP0209 /ASSEMBLY_ACC=CAM_ASM_000301 /LENGTH=116 /DNA_ID=CAMNT_0010816053 /DNA_START=189 /DNA_END=536 /DNA_ORIENTATION=+
MNQYTEDIPGILDKLDLLFKSQFKGDLSTTVGLDNQPIKEASEATNNKSLLNFFLTKEISNQRIKEVERRSETSLLLHWEEVLDLVFEEVLLEEVLEMNAIETIKSNHQQLKDKAV